MTQKQIIAYNKMLMALQRISKQYMTPKQIKRDSSDDFVEYTEYLEMSYENIQQEAKNTVKGLKLLPANLLQDADTGENTK